MPLMVDRFVMICRSDHPLARKKAVSWAEMVNWPMITMARTSSVRQHIDAACAAAGIESPSRYDPEHLATAGALVRQGLGIAALPSLATPLLRFPGIREVPIHKPMLERTMGFLQRRGRTASLAAQDLIGAIRKAV